jgi:hypothetical protein
MQLLRRFDFAIVNPQKPARFFNAVGAFYLGDETSMLTLIGYLDHGGLLGSRYKTIEFLV